MEQSQEPIIRCAYKKIEDVSALQPHPLNPNKHEPKQIEMFIAILKYQGCRRPVTVSNRSGFVTKGHGQLESYKAAGWTKVPVDYQDYDDEKSEMADMVADNQLAKLSEMSNVKLQELCVNLDTGDFNMELIGMQSIQLESLMLTNHFSSPELSLPTSAGPEQMDGPLRKVEFVTGEGQGADGVHHVRMVQLFLNDSTQAELLKIAEHFREKLGTDNITDTVMGIVRLAYERDRQTN